MCQEHRKPLAKQTAQVFMTLRRPDEQQNSEVNFTSSLPGMVPRLELSKNCLGQVLDSSSELPPTSKNLLLGESSRLAFGESSSFLGDSKTFLGESRTFLGVTRNFLGELRKLEESEVMGRPLLVGVQGGEGFSFLVFPFNLMALLFHLLISACWLDTKLMEQENRCQSKTRRYNKSHENQSSNWLPFQPSYFQTKLFDFLLKFGFLQHNAALDHPTSGVGQSGMKVFTLQDWIQHDHTVISPLSR